jgi:hypothetical protein
MAMPSIMIVIDRDKKKFGGAKHLGWLRGDYVATLN